MDYDLIVATMATGVAFANGVGWKVAAQKLSDADAYISRRLKRDAEAAKLSYDEERHGPDRLGAALGDSDWVVIPRALAQEGLGGFQQHLLAVMLEDLRERFPGAPQDCDYEVRAKKGGKYVAVPKALTEWRNPKYHVLQAWRQHWKSNNYEGNNAG